MKKNICFLVDSIFSTGGVQRVTAVIAKELAKDNDITIVTFDDPSSEETSLYGLKEVNIKYRYIQYPLTGYWKERFCKAYSYAYRKFLPQNKITSDLYAHSSFPSEKRNTLIQELKRGNYDVIIGVHAMLAVRLAACRPFIGKSKLIGWIHNSYEALFGKNSQYYIGPELQKHYEYQLQKLDHTIVLSKDDAKRYHFPVQVIYNPLTLKPGSPAKGDSKKFLAVGRFSRRHKGFDILIEAFNLFAKEDQEWTLDIVGEGEEEPMYKDMISKYQLGNRIHIHPFTSHIQSYYSDAQVYVLSSRWEGMPLVLMEAMSHGLPIVSSDLPICMEIMGGFGLFFENGNVGQLAERLKEATKMDWQKKSDEALAIAQRFDIESMSSQWKNIIYER